MVIEQNAGHREMMIDGRRHKVSAFIQDLRMRLWRDYLGLTTEADELLKNPCKHRPIDSILRNTNSV